MNNSVRYEALAVYLCLASLYIYFMALWTDRNLEYYLDKDIELWISALITLALAPVVFALNAVGELLRLVI